MLATAWAVAKPPYDYKGTIEMNLTYLLTLDKWCLVWQVFWEKDKEHVTAQQSLPLRQMYSLEELSVYQQYGK